LNDKELSDFLNSVKSSDLLVSPVLTSSDDLPASPVRFSNKGLRSKAKFFLDPKTSSRNYHSGERSRVKDNLLCENAKFFHDNFNRSIRNITVPGVDKPHRHKKSKKINTNLKAISDIEFNSFATQFKEYLEECQAFPVYLKGNEYNKVSGINKNRVFELKNRFQSDRNIRALSNALDRFNGNAVFLTLTIDPKRHSWLYSWTHISSKLNSFIKTLRKKTGIKKLNYVYVVETQLKSTYYPHIHILLLGIKRLAHWQDVAKWWGWGFIWLNKTKEGKKIRNPVAYMMKYIRKGMVPISDFSSKSFKNAVLLWLFDKRQFGKSLFLMQFLKVLFIPFINSDIVKNYIVYSLDPQGGYMAYWRKLHNIEYSGYVQVLQPVKYS